MSRDTSNGRLRALATVAVGNLIEIYSIMIVAYLTVWWSRRYFPAYASNQILAPLSYGISYFARPAGAILFGIVADRIGRRTSLVATLAVTGAALAVIALLPGYLTLGAAAPVVIVAVRLLQGMTIDAETAAATAYLYETAPPGRGGFFVAWLAAGNYIAPLLGFLAVALLVPVDSRSVVDAATDPTRIPLLIAAVALPFAAVLQFLVSEPGSFQSRTIRPGAWKILAAVLADWRTLGFCVLLASLLILLSGFVSGALSYFSRPALRNLGVGDVRLLSEIGFGASSVVAFAVGWLGDRVGRRGLLLSTIVLTLLTVPLLVLMANAWPSYTVLLLAQLWVGALLGSYAGLLYVTLAEVMPIEVRATGVGLALSLSAAIFGAVNVFILGILQQPPGPIIYNLGGVIVLAVAWPILVSLICLPVALKVRNWLALASAVPAALPRLPAAAAPKSPPTAVDDPDWREKLIASLADAGVERADPGSYLAQRLGWGLLAMVLLLIAAFVSQFVIPEAFRRDPQGALVAAVVWWIFSALVLSRPAIGALRRSWRAGARSAEQELRRAGSRRPIFYLRSFDLDEKIGRVSIVEMLGGRSYANAEQGLAKRLRRYGPVIAIGRPGEKLPALGAARFYVSHEQWKAKVADVVRASQFVVWATGTTEGLQWEISHLLESLPPEKLIVWAHPHLLRLLPPDREIEWQRFLAVLGRVFPQPLPGYLGIMRFFHFDNAYRPIPETSLRAVLKAKGAKRQ
jgi:MFS family permease